MAGWDVVFGWPAAWGKVGDVRNKDDDPSFPEDLDFEQEVEPTIARNVATSGGLARLEFMRLVIGGTPPVPEPPAAWYANYGTTVAYFATEFAAEVEATADGPPYQIRTSITITSCRMPNGSTCAGSTLDSTSKPPSRR